jgi:hypothetical protein
VAELEELERRLEAARAQQRAIGRVLHAVAPVEAEPVDELQLKGFARPVTAYKVKRLLTT